MRGPFVTVLVCAVVWAASGVPVLAVALHDHLHHAGPHHHRADLHAALHGHAHEGHEGMPDHDHALTAPPSAHRPPVVGHALAAALEARSSLAVEPDTGPVADRSSPRDRHHRPPPYLELGALLI